MTPTAILYARVSTDEQATSGYSLRQQIEALERTRGGPRADRRRTGAVRLRGGT